MKTIKLSQNKYSFVDDEDYEYLNQWNWNTCKKGGNYYGLRIGNLKALYIHRLVLERHNVIIPKGSVTDHINGNGLDNRLENLRVCTVSQNGMNRKIGINNTSGYKGVHWNKHNKSWRVIIGKGKVKKFIGYFPTARSGAIAYDLWANDLFGKYAKLNFERATNERL